MGNSFAVSGAPASSNLNVRNDGTLYGSIHAVASSGSGTVTGSVTVPVPTKQMPASTVFDTYLAMATQLTFSGDLDKDVLTPTLNQYGGDLNANGVYYINTSGSELRIQASRIHGTLLVDVGSNKVRIDGPALLHTYRSDFPVLIVRGTGAVVLELRQNSQGSNLSELLQLKNYNPSGAPYNGTTDIDTLDTYSDEIQGLVYVIGGNVSVRESNIIRGALIVDGGGLTVDGNSGSNYPTIVYTPSLFNDPPLGFTGSKLELLPGSWLRDAAP